MSRVLMVWLMVLLTLLAVGSQLSSADVEEVVLSLFDGDMLPSVENQYGVEARQRVAAWRELMLNMRASGAEARDKSLSANDFFNQVPWVADMQHWGQEDYWATPTETLASNGGDCEDFSIGKFFTLAAGGVDTGKLRITYVKAVELDQPHMVLAYYDSPTSDPLILDNINKTVLPASMRPDLLPVYSFNAEGLWLAKSGGAPLSTSSGLPQWSELLARMGAARLRGK